MGHTLTELSDTLCVDPEDVRVVVQSLGADALAWEEEDVVADHLLDDLHQVLDPHGERTVPELYPDRPPGTVVLPVTAAWADQPGVVHVPSARAGLPGAVTRCGHDITARVPRDEVPDDAQPCAICFDPDY